MSPVGTGDHTAAASDALLPMKLRENNGVAFQNIGRITDSIQRKPHRLADLGKALLRQVIVEPRLEIVDDAVALLHHRRGDLNAARTEQDKLQRV